MLQYTKRFYVPLTRYSLAALLLFSIISSAGINTCKAINKPIAIKTVLSGDTIFTKVDKQPVFPGGMDAFIKYLSKNVRYPEAMRERGVEDKVIARFVIEIDGSISTVKILDGPGYGSSEEAIRVLKKSPKWQPGYNKGKPVRVQLTVPIDFRAGDDRNQGHSGFKVING
jgi:TonB family protein